MSEKNQTQTTSEAPAVEAMDQKSEYPSNLPAVGTEFINERKMTLAQAQQAAQVLAKVTAYTGAKSHSADEFLNNPVKIVGAISQPVNLEKEVVDTESGEVIKVSTPANRIVAKMENGEVISFVSKSADSFFNNFVFPIYGKGDFPFPLTLKITQVSRPQGRTFNFSVIA